MDQQKHWNNYFSPSIRKPFNLNSYNQNVRSLLIEIKKIINNLELKNKNILDIGGGDGKTTSYFFPKSKLHIVDISNIAIQKANKNGINAITTDLEIDRIPYMKNHFDFILSNQVIEHIKNLDNFFKETHRVLKKGGMFLITTPNINSLSSRIRLLFGYPPTTSSFDPTHIQIINFNILTKMLKKYGFKTCVVSTNYAYFPTNKTLIPIPLLHKLNINFGEQIIILSQKL